MRSNFTGICAQTLEYLSHIRVELADMKTEYDTPARLAKILLFYIATSRAVCENRGLEKYPISTLKKIFFATANYNWITLLVDEAEAIENIIILAVHTAEGIVDD